MSRASYEVKHIYTGTGLLDTYTFDFKIEEKKQLLVIETNAAEEETQRVRGTDLTYLSSVTFDAVDGGGTVVLAANLGPGSKLILLLANDEPTQPYEFRNKTSFTLKRFESALDWIAGAVQRLTYRSNQSIRIHDLDDEETFNTMLDPGIDGPNNYDRVVKVNGDGTGFELGASYGDIDSAVDYAAAALASQNAAAVSAAAAAEDADDAATAAGSTGWTEVSLKTATNNNNTLLASDVGTLFLIDATAGSVNLYLPNISTVDQAIPHSMGFKRNPTDVSGNAITITASGVDKIDDASTTVITLPTSGNSVVEMIGNDVHSPDRWQSIQSGVGAHNALADTKGDIVTHTGSAVSKLAVGSDDYVLQAKASETTGLTYGVPIQRYVNELGLTQQEYKTASGALSWKAIATNSSQATLIAVAANSASGAMRSTDDGLTWTGQTIGSKPYVDLIYSTSASLWVALASTGTTAVETTNGAGTWTARTTTSKTWQCLADNGTIIVAMNLDGSGGDGAMYSSDGITWTDSTACQDEVWVDISTDGTTFVAVGAGGKISTSTDGDTWTARTSGTSTAFDCIEWDGTKYMALAGSECLTSTDGITWTEVNGATTFTATNRSLKYCDGVWIALLSDYIASSIDDGLSWKIKRYNLGTMEQSEYHKGRLVTVKSSGTDRVVISPKVMGE